MKLNKRGDSEFLTKRMVYWLLIAAAAVIIWFIVNGIITKLVTLY